MFKTSKLFTVLIAMTIKPLKVDPIKSGSGAFGKEKARDIKGFYSLS